MTQWQMHPDVYAELQRTFSRWRSRRTRARHSMRDRRIGREAHCKHFAQKMQRIMKLPISGRTIRFPIVVLDKGIE